MRISIRVGKVRTPSRAPSRSTASSTASLSRVQQQSRASIAGPALSRRFQSTEASPVQIQTNQPPVNSLKNTKSNQPRITRHTDVKTLIKPEPKFGDWKTFVKRGAGGNIRLQVVNTAEEKPKREPTPQQQRARDKYLKRKSEGLLTDVDEAIRLWDKWIDEQPEHLSPRSQWAKSVLHNARGVDDLRKARDMMMLQWRSGKHFHLVPASITASLFLSKYYKFGEMDAAEEFFMNPNQTFVPSSSMINKIVMNIINRFHGEQTTATSGKRSQNTAEENKSGKQENNEENKQSETSEKQNDDSWIINDKLEMDEARKMGRQLYRIVEARNLMPSPPLVGNFMLLAKLTQDYGWAHQINARYGTFFNMRAANRFAEALIRAGKLKEASAALAKQKSDDKTSRYSNLIEMTIKILQGDKQGARALWNDISSKLGEDQVTRSLTLQYLKDFPTHHFAALPMKQFFEEVKSEGGQVLPEIEQFFSDVTPERVKELEKQYNERRAQYKQEAEKRKADKEATLAATEKVRVEARKERAVRIKSEKEASDLAKQAKKAADKGKGAVKGKKEAAT